MSLDLKQESETRKELLNPNPEIQKQLTQIRNSRNEKFKNFDLELKNVDDHMMDYRSMIKNQPLVFLDSYYRKESDSLSNILRCFEKLFSDDKIFPLRNNYKGKNQPDKEEIITNLCRYMYRQFRRQHQTRMKYNSVREELNNILEINNLFCYVRHTSVITPYRFFVADCHSENLKLLGYQTDTYLDKIQDKEFVNILNNIKNEYNLKNEDVFHLFSNMLERFNYEELNIAIVDNNLMKSFTTEFCKTSEDYKLLDEIFYKKLDKLLRNFISNSYSYISNFDSEIKPSSIALTKSFQDVGLQKSALISAKALSILKYSKDTLLNSDEIKQVYDNTTFHDDSQLLEYIKPYLLNTMQLDANAFAKTNDFFEFEKNRYYQSKKNTYELLNKVKAEIDNCNGNESTLFLDNLLPTSFLSDDWIYASDIQQLGFIAGKVPYLAPSLILMTEDVDSFIDFALEYGVDLDSVDEALKYRESKESC